LDEMNYLIVHFVNYHTVRFRALTCSDLSLTMLDLVGVLEKQLEVTIGAS
jgi:hypothetical protein